MRTTRLKRRLFNDQQDSTTTTTTDGDVAAVDEEAIITTTNVDNMNTPKRHRKKRRFLSPSSTPEKSAVLVTPSSSTVLDGDTDNTTATTCTPLQSSKPHVCRTLAMPSPSSLSSPLAAVSEESDESDEADATTSTSSTTVKGPFGRDARTTIKLQDSTEVMYRKIAKQTGQIGGNGSFGAIYGELTQGSMQKVIDIMKVHTNFSSESKFIDIGSGLGKPNLHVTQDPGVSFSYGVEMELSRYMLGLANLKKIVDRAVEDQQQKDTTPATSMMRHQCYFEHGNIMDAKTFDPFTHVYAFSIGFPPNLWEALRIIFDKSTTAKYLICYLPPRYLINKYKFNVELITQESTSMHVSSEGHMCYFYKRIGVDDDVEECNGEGEDKCDPLFQEAYDVVRNSTLKQYQKYVNKEHHDKYESGRLTRSKAKSLGRVMCVESSSE